MQKVLRKIAQFQLVYEVEKDDYFIKNNLSEEKSFTFGKNIAENLLVMDKYNFLNRYIQRAGNNLQKKIQ